ncbi:MAG: hypothetical protein ACO1QR_16630 [Chthoniobacteraceae bacterium]
MTVLPFDELHVKEPRRVEPSVLDLNARALQQLLAAFERLEQGPLPREPIAPSHAQLVTSEQPGYGKSHLIGRLFRGLNGRATLVYVQPFQNSGTVFQSLMLAVARELHFPARQDATPWDPSEPTQLDLLAHHVLAHLLADLVLMRRDIDTDEPEEKADYLRKHALQAFNRGDKNDTWANLVRTQWKALEGLYQEALARRGAAVSSPRAWLRVLLAYAFHPFDYALRQACLDWMCGLPCTAEEQERIGLSPAAAVDPEISAEQANDLCRTRIADLCQLARFHRPFVFCFDQTEVYGHQPHLARSFGMVVAALVNEAVNHLTLVTSNQEPWQKRIAPNIEHADLERIAQPPVTLEGIRRKQAEELISLRLASWNVPEQARRQFADPAWLGEIFSSEGMQIATRRFLQKCKERWRPELTLPPPDLGELYRQECEKLLASPKRRYFEPDALQWLVEEAARGVEGIAVDRVKTERYCPVRWQMAERTYLFGFETGSHWRRWHSIAQYAVRRNGGEGPPVRTIFFRTADQPPVPGPRWVVAAEIEEAKRKDLHLITLTSEEAAALYAAKDLFAAAAQGDIPYTEDEVFAFLRTQLAPWWTRLTGGPAAPAETPAPEAKPASDSLPGDVRRIVERARFLSLDEVIAQLGTPATPQAVLTACGAIPAIKVHSHPNMTVLQWQTG